MHPCHAFTQLKVRIVGSVKGGACVGHLRSASLAHLRAHREPADCGCSCCNLSVSRTLCLYLSPLHLLSIGQVRKRARKEENTLLWGYMSNFVRALFLTKSVTEEGQRSKVEFGKSNLKWKEQCFSEFKIF